MPPDVQQFFQEWASQFAADHFTTDISWDMVPCWMERYEDAARHIDVLEERLSRVLTQLQEL